MANGKGLILRANEGSREVICMADNTKYPFRCWILRFGDYLLFVIWCLVLTPECMLIESHPILSIMIHASGEEDRSGKEGRRFGEA